MNPFEEPDYPYTFRTSAKFIRVECPDCGESFFTEKQFTDMGGSLSAQYYFKCSYCKGDTAFDMVYYSLPVKNEPYINEPYPNHQTGQAVENFSQFLNNPNGQVLRLMFHKFGEKIHKTMLECLERYENRVPTDQEVAHYGKMHYTPDGVALFQWKNVLLFRCFPYQHLRTGELLLHMDTMFDP